MIVETTKHVWVTINRRVSQIATPIPIHEKASKIAEDQITTLYTLGELYEILPPEDPKLTVCHGRMC